MKYLFAYGTLQLPLIQKEVFGRELVRVDPSVVQLKGFKLEQLVIEDTPYFCGVATGDDNDIILGTVWEIEDSDIPLLDEFETSAYTKFDLLSIKDCIIYIKS